MGIVADLIARVSADTSGFTAEMESVNRSLAEAGKKAQQSLDGFNRFGSELSSIGTKLSVVFTLPIIGGGAAALKAATDMDTLRRGLETTMGSAAAAGVEFKKLNELAKLPGIGLPEAVKGSERLQNLGLSADKSRKIMAELGNAIALAGGGKADFEEAIRQLGQMSSVGKVTKENLDPIIERVPQIAKFMRDAFGPEAIGDPAKFFTKAGISSQQFIDVMVDALAKGARAQDGLKNTSENFSQAVQKAFSVVGDAIVKATDGQAKVNELTSAIESAAEKFAALPDSVKTATIAVAGFAAGAPLAIFAAGQIAQAMVSIATAFKLIQSLNIVGAFSSVTFAMSNGLIGALTLGEKAMLAFASAAAVAGGAIAGWSLGSWIRDITGLGSAVDSVWKKFDPLLSKLGLTTQVLKEQTRADSDAVFAKKKFEDAQTAVTKRTAEASLAAAKHQISLAGAAAAAKALGEAHEISGGPIRRTTAFFLEQLEVFERLTKAQQDYALVLESIDRDPVSDIQSPTLNAPEFDEALKRKQDELKKAASIGGIIEEGIDQGEAAAAKQFPKITDHVKKTQKAVSEFGQQVSTVMTDLSRGIADAIIHGKSIGDVFKRVGQDIAESIVRFAIEKGIKLLINNLDTVLGKLGSIGKAIADVFGGGASAAGSAAGGAASAGGSAAGGASSIGSAASGVMGIANLATSAVSAVSSVIGNFQFAHMNTALGRIEESTRFTQIRVANIEQQILTYLPKLNDIHNRLIEISANTFGGGERGTSQLILNVDGRRLADALVPYIGRTIQVSVG
jgi:tape measure domain-containing protein